MVKRYLIAAAAVFSASTQAAANQILVACSVAGKGIQAITPMFTVADDELGGSSVNMGPADIADYGKRFNSVVSITFYSETGIVGQFAKSATERFGRDGNCFASTDRELMVKAYQVAKQNGYEKNTLRTWKPTGDRVLRTEEWVD